MDGLRGRPAGDTGDAAARAAGGLVALQLLEEGWWRCSCLNGAVLRVLQDEVDALRVVEVAEHPQDVGVAAKGQRAEQQERKKRGVHEVALDFDLGAAASARRWEAASAATSPAPARANTMNLLRAYSSTWSSRQVDRAELTVPAA